MTGVLAVMVGIASSTGSATITLSDFYVEDTTGPGYLAGFRVATTGTVAANAAATGWSNLPQNWTDDGGATASLYDVRATTLTGDPLDSDDGVWLNLGTTRTYLLSGIASGTYSVEIRLNSSGVVQASCVATLVAAP